MKEVVVSVLMTAYNREKYIADAIDSVLSSTWKEFELIVVDDCSTDSTFAIAEAYEKKDSRVKVYKNSENLGQFLNRNKVASLATGKYIKYLDSDDLIYPHSLEIMVQAMISYPDAGIGVCEKYRDSGRPYPYCFTSREVLQHHYLLHELLLIGPSGTIIKKEAFDAVKGFEDYGMPSDNHLTLKIAALHPVVMLQRDLFWWRIHSGQVFQQTVNDEKNMLNNYRFNADILDNYSPLEEALNRKIRFNLSKIFFRNMLRLTWKKRRPFAAVKLVRQYIRDQSSGKKA